MKTEMNWRLIILFFISVSLLHSMAQAVSLDDKYSRIIDRGDCKYKIEGLTKGSAPMSVTFTASLEMQWSLTGPATNLVIADSAFVTEAGTGTVTAEFDQTYALDFFDDYEGLITGKHALNGQVLHNTGENKTVVCQFYANNDDGCTEEIAKAVGNTPCNHSPIVLDLDGDGFDFSGPDGAVAFDLYATGEPVVIQWVVPMGDDAFLVRDTNGNGIVDDGTELFGNGTPLILEGNAFAPNGFVALAQFDEPVLGGNGDGVIDARDRIWSELGLWLDDDADGRCHPEELFGLDLLGLTTLDIVPRETDWWDDHHNWLRYLAWAHGDVRHLMVDVFFREVR